MGQSATEAPATVITAEQDPVTEWEEMSGLDVDTFDALSVDDKIRWVMAVSEGTHSAALADELQNPGSKDSRPLETKAADTAVTDRDLLDDAVRVLRQKDAHPDERLGSLAYLADVAHFPDANDKRNGLDTQAMKALLDNVSDDPQYTKALVNSVKGATGPRGHKVAQNGRLKPWFTHLQAKGLINHRDGISLDSLVFPADAATREALGLTDLYNTQQQQELAKEQSTTSSNVESAGALDVVAEAILAVQNEPELVARMQKLRAAGDAYTFYKIKHSGTAPVFGQPVESFFTKRGSDWKLNLQQDSTTGSHNVFSRVEGDEDVSLLDAVKAFDTGRNMLDLDSHDVIDGPMNVKKVELKVRSILRKFSIKPNISVFRNMDDLKTKNPALYKKAKAARAQNDFDNPVAPPMAYSFGANIIFFSDRIFTDKQLAFVTAHETLGHIGLRSMFSQTQLNNELATLYASDKRLQNRIDEIAFARNIGKLEATEEWIADHIARLDTSFLARMTNMLKRGFNAVGIKWFYDDAARELISQLKRHGKSGTFMSTDQLVANMNALAADAHAGRFSLSPLEEGGMAAKAAATRGAVHIGDRFGNGILGIRQFLRDNDTKRFYRNISGTVRNPNDGLVAVMQHVQTLDFKASKNAGLERIFKLFSQQSQMVRTLLNDSNQRTKFSNTSDRFGLKSSAPSSEDKLLAGRALAFSALKMSQIADSIDLEKYDNIIGEDGRTVDEAALAKLIEDSKVSREDLAEGLEWREPTGELIRLQKVVLSDKAWRVFEEQRDAINQSAVALLRSRYEAVNTYRGHGFEILGEMRKAFAMIGNRCTLPDLLH